MQRLSQRILTARWSPSPPKERTSSTSQLEFDHHDPARGHPAAPTPTRTPYRARLQARRARQGLTSFCGPVCVSCDARDARFKHKASSNDETLRQMRRFACHGGMMKQIR